MLTLTTATQAAPQAHPKQTFSFYVAATGAAIKLEAADYLSALPLVLATCNALDTSKIELLQGDANAVAIHSFVAEHGVGALDQLRAAFDGESDEMRHLSNLLDGYLGPFDDMQDVGRACLTALDSSLDHALSPYVDLFDFEAYARECETEGHIFTIQTADNILLFVLV